MKFEKLFNDSSKFIKKSLSFLDITWVRITIMVIIILYIVGGIQNFGYMFVDFLHNPIVKILFVLFVIYIAIKDIPLALLLIIAYILSLRVGLNNLVQLDAKAKLGPAELQGGVNAGLSGVDVGAKAGLGDLEAKFQANIGDGTVEGMFGGNTENPEGYNINKFFDCTKDCNAGGSLNGPCKGVGVWNNESNAQGLNCPSGFSGEREGAPF